MGHSWSLFFCQRAIELRAASVPELVGCSIMRDRGPSILLRRAEHQGDDPRRILRVFDPSAGAHYYIYVDNLGVLSNNADDAKRRLDGIIRALENFGPVVHETEISSGKVRP